MKVLFSSLQRRSPYRSLVCLPILLACTPATSQTLPRIHAITLSSGGVAEIHRQADLTDQSALRIDVPLAQVDDILKSLVVRDPAGGVAGMTLDGLSPVDETFGRLPFTPQDMGSVAALAASLQGVSASASSGGRSVEGRILGVAQIDAGTDSAPRTEQVLSVMTEAGQVQTLRLGADATLDILDPALRERVAQAAQISGRARTDGVRAIDIALAGQGARQVELSYVVSAPVWKTAYRLVTGDDPKQARLQAWAVIENATAENWQDVNLTLTSGAPVLLAQHLHQRYWHERVDVPVSGSAAQAPRADQYQAEAVQDAAAGAGAPAGMPARSLRAQAPMPAPPPAPAPISGAADAAVAQEGETAATYRLPKPVSLAAGKTLSVPYLDVSLPGERVSVFQAGRASRHPVAAVLLENTAKTSLPAGLLTVYDTQSGHVGDAQLLGLPAGQSRLASFAEDRKVTITTENQPQERITEIVLSDGALRATRLSRLVTTYTVQGAPDASRNVLIEHPRRNGWTFKSDAADGQTPTHHRLKLTVKAGASAKVVATAERSQVQEVALLDTDAQTLLMWSGTAADAKTAARLKMLAERRAELSRAQLRVQRLDESLEQARQNQARVRDNLGAVPADSTLGQRYAKMLGDEEDRIAKLQQEREQAQKAAEQAHQTLAQAMQG